LDPFPEQSSLGGDPEKSCPVRETGVFRPAQGCKQFHSFTQKFGCSALSANPQETALTPDSGVIDRYGVSFPKSLPGCAIGNNLAPKLAGKVKFT